MCIGNAWEGPTQIASKVEGAVAYKITKGDMIMIPENTPYTVSEVDGKLVVWALHLPRPAPKEAGSSVGPLKPSPLCSAPAKAAN